MKDLREIFGYDELDRLTDIWLNNVHTGHMSYDAFGRMTDKQSDGQQVFASAQHDYIGPDGQLRPHAISSAEMGENPFPTEQLDIDYTMFDKVRRIADGIFSPTTVELEYGYDHQRTRMRVENPDDSRYGKTYVDGCEFVEHNGIVDMYTYLCGPLGVFAVNKLEVNGCHFVDRLHYVYKDHLGSWTTITDANGTVVREQSFDAWGNMRNPYTWTGNTVLLPMFDRGYTGHEHLNSFGLINMNGRMYDPVMSSFLSVDNYVQNPDFSQNFNRYAYCLNNPLRYTDPDGEWVQYVIGGVLGGINGYSIGKAAGLEGWDLAWATIGGAVVGAATVGIGNVVSSAGGAVLGGAAAGATAGAGNGLISGLATNSSNLGQDILNGAWKGLVSGAVGGYVSGNLFTGGVGAFLGGSAANLTGQICNYVTNDNNSINWWSVGLSGLTSLGGYHAMLYQGYLKGDFKNVGLKYGEYSKMMQAIQQSMRSGREAKFIEYYDPQKAAYINISGEENSIGTSAALYKGAKFDMHTHDKFGCDGFSDYARAVQAGQPIEMCDFHTAGQLYMLGYSNPRYLATAEGHFWMMNNCTPIPIAIPNGTGFNISFSYSWNPQMVTNYNYSHLFHSYQYNFILKY